MGFILILNFQIYQKILEVLILCAYFSHLLNFSGSIVFDYVLNVKSIVSNINIGLEPCLLELAGGRVKRGVVFADISLIMWTSSTYSK